MIHTKEDFFNKVATDIRTKFFPEVAFYRDNENCTAATYAIELFNNGCITYRTFISRLSKSCNSNNATIHNIVEKYITSFGEYQYKPKSKWSTDKVGVDWKKVDEVENRMFGKNKSLLKNENCLQDELIGVLKTLCQVATDTTANIVGFDGANELDTAIDNAKRVISKAEPNS